MTSLSILRKFTTDDQASLNASAQRFAQRHGLLLDRGDIEDLGIASALDQYLACNDTGTWPRVKDLKRLWQSCRCRALNVKVNASITVGFGYIGYSVR